MNPNALRSPEPEVPLSGYETLPEYLLDKAKEFTQLGKSYYAIDAVTKEKRYFNKFDDETKRIASALYKKGLKKGSTVIHMAGDAIKFHIFIVGVWRANGICRATYKDDDSGTLAGRVKQSLCKFILCDGDRLEVVQKAISNVDWEVTIVTTDNQDGYLSIPEMLNDDGTACPSLQISGSDPALILCTSGTTGRPKGAVHTHHGILEQIHLFRHLPFTEDKPNLMLSSIMHYGGTVFPLILLVTGKTAIVTKQVSRKVMLNAVHEMKPGLVLALPTYLLMLVGSDAQGYDLSSLEILYSYGSILKPSVRTALLSLPNVKDIGNDYGLTEAPVGATTATMNLTSKTPTFRDVRNYCVGKPFPGTCIQVRDLDTLKILGPNRQGEIFIKDRFAFQAYIDNSQAKDKAYIDDFMRTGDLGYYDEQGYLYVIDRLKEIFKFYNNQISPSEIEAIIEEHPAVKEVCVVGVPYKGGDVPRAYVTLTSSYTQISSNISREIQSYANGKLPDYKHLRGGLMIVHELPKGMSGKVSRKLVTNLIQLDMSSRLR